MRPGDVAIYHGSREEIYGQQVQILEVQHNSSLGTLIKVYASEKYPNLSMNIDKVTRVTRGYQDFFQKQQFPFLPFTSLFGRIDE